MQIEDELARLSPKRDTVLTIGVFDGVHLGHQQLLRQVKELARQEDLLPGAITFRQHPRDVLARTRPPCLTTLKQRVRLIKDQGIELVVLLPFTPQLASLSSRQFVSLLKEYLGMRRLVVGPDFALGRGREGNPAALQRLGEELGFGVTVVPPMVVNGEVVSSTSLRQAVADGDVLKVNRLTGRWFRLHGRVVSGVGRGRGLGFPTANLEINSEQALPANGVYATWAYLDDKAYPSLTNIGERPTFAEKGRTVEVYLLDYQGDLYGRELQIETVDRIRPEQRFGTAEELKAQIAADIDRGRAILDASPVEQHG
ncbi:MAG: bifunctional riboflavin kinase/FAD synthetase [Chloroflexota bacterium]